MSTQHNFTAGIDLGDRYSHLCLLDVENGEVIEESRIATSREAFERRFSGAEPMRIAIETGTHSPWVSRMLEDSGHEVLVANARKVRLIYGEGRKTDEIDALRNWPDWLDSTPGYFRRSSTAARIPRRT
jgi:transposase